MKQKRDYKWEYWHGGGRDRAMIAKANRSNYYWTHRKKCLTESRKWQEDHKQRRRKICNAWYQRNKKEQCKRNRARRWTNIEETRRKEREDAKLYRLKHPIKERRRAREYYHKHAAKKREYSRNWQAKHRKNKAYRDKISKQKRDSYHKDWLKNREKWFFKRYNISNPTKEERTLCRRKVKLSKEWRAILKQSRDGETSAQELLRRLRQLGLKMQLRSSTKTQQR